MYTTFGISATMIWMHKSKGSLDKIAEIWSKLQYFVIYFIVTKKNGARSLSMVQEYKGTK